MEDILDAIKCAICKQILNSPVILPCAHSVCKKHTEELATNKHQIISCNECGQDHAKQVFLPNQALAKIIASKIATFDMGQEHKTARQSCDNLETVIKQFEQLLNDPSYFTYEEIDELERQVQLKREELKKQIDDEFDKVYNKLEEYKKSCKMHLATNKYINESNKILQEIKKARKELNDWLGVLNEVKMSNEGLWKRIKAQSETSIKDLNNKMEVFKKELLLQKFNDMNSQVKSLQNINIDSAFSVYSDHESDPYSHFAIDMKYDKFNFQSNIINNSEQREKLFNLCNIGKNEIWRLVYRGSRDGFGVKDFHRKCDNRPKTLTVIKADTGNIFGGYTQTRWNQIDPTDYYKADPKAFLFSLVNKMNVPCKFNIAKADKAIGCHSLYGPIFGEYSDKSGHSICIGNISNLTNINHASIGSSFQLPDDFLFSICILLNLEPECKCINNNTRNDCHKCKFLAGTYNFKVTEIEVFQQN